jgi:hypothetical protein
MTYQEMTEPNGGRPELGGLPDEGTHGSGGQQAREKVAATTDAVRSAAGDVATEAGNQARAVLDQARGHATDLFETSRQELTTQAQVQTDRAAPGLKTRAQQVQALAEGRPHDAGQVADWLRDGQQRLSAFARRLDEHGPQGLLDDASRLARRRPLVFLGACVGAGFAVGRIVKDVKPVLAEQGARSASLPAPSGVSASAPPAAAPSSSADLSGMSGGVDVDPLLARTPEPDVELRP